MKQSAVEWLKENLQVILTQSQFNDVVIQDVIKQAKEMEKQQIIDAFYGEAKSTSILDGEQYYNETFKDK
jgi:uncharacterized protein YjgD (DUF1641 family)